MGFSSRMYQLSLLLWFPWSSYTSSGERGGGQMEVLVSTCKADHNYHLAITHLTEEAPGVPEKPAQQRVHRYPMSKPPRKWKPHCLFCPKLQIALHFLMLLSEFMFTQIQGGKVRSLCREHVGERYWRGHHIWQRKRSWR